jgi:hypothetical protein
MDQLPPPKPPAPVSGALEAPPHVLDAPALPGVTCLACGYDLRGLAPDGACPECGTPIAFSVRGDFYRFGDPDRIGRLATGASIIGITLLLALPWSLLLYIVDARVLLHASSGRGTITALGTGAWILVHAWGWWMLGEREPGLRDDGPRPGVPGGAARGERARAWMRDSLLVFVAVSLGAIAVGLLRSRAWGGGTPTGHVLGRNLAGALWLASMAAGVGLLLTGMRHVMAMSRRLPPGRLATRTEFLFLLVATLAAMMAVSAGGAGLFYGLGMHDAVGMLTSVCGCMSVPLWSIVYIGVWLTAHGLAAALRREQALARELRREPGRAPIP